MEQDPPIEHRFVQTAVLVDIKVEDTVVKPTVDNNSSPKGSTNTYCQVQPTAA